MTVAPADALARGRLQSADVPLLLDSSLYRFNLYALPWGVVAIALFVLAGVIFARQRASRVAVLFCTMILLVGVWLTGFAGMLSCTQPAEAVVWARLAIAAVAFLPAAIYDFTATALRLHAVRRWLTLAIWLVSAGFAAVTLFSRSMIGGMSSQAWGFYPRAGKLFSAFLLFFVAVLAGHIVEYVTQYRSTLDLARRRRLVRLAVSFAIVYVAAVDFIPMYRPATPPVGYIPVVLFIIVAWRSIRSHRFGLITAARASREILQTMADALFVIDSEARIRVVNDAVLDLLGYADHELLGRSIDRLEVVRDDQTISRTLAEISRRGGPIREQERVFRNVQGQAIDVSVSISPVTEGAEQQGAVVIARDIRERKHAEEELRSFTRRLEQSNRELEDFAYVASHDLQEPLRKIQAFADLLKSKHAEHVPPQARDYLDRMQSAAGRMQVLINDLLTFSRVTTKAQPFVPVDLNAVAHDVAKDLDARIHQSEGSLTIGELPEIDADPLQMRQLLQNLAANALKFHRPGVAPAVRITAEAHAGDRCRLLVSDNGIGFEEKYADRIFTMFERLHGRGKYEGTGIGLAICRKIAERHGGEIEARSRPGEGSTFIVTLPLRHLQEREYEHSHA